MLEIMLMSNEKYSDDRNVSIDQTSEIFGTDRHVFSLVMFHFVKTSGGFAVLNRFNWFGAFLLQFA